MFQQTEGGIPEDNWHMLQVQPQAATACPLGGTCKTNEAVYKATVAKTDTNQSEIYTGLTGGTFKTRYNKHMLDFRTPRQKTA